MDTGTHIMMGVALAGIATLDPAVANDPILFNAVLAGTVVGSQAPDFDTILKFRNNATYLKHHRGITHSIPATLIWPLLVSGIIFQFAPQVNFYHLFTWTFIAVILHVFVDLFNAYGTQAMRPFSNRWIAFGFINTFDPYIFSLHVVGLVAWILGAKPGVTWLIIYFVIFLYYIKRYLDKREIVEKITQHFPDTTDIATSPTIKQNIWRVAITTEDYLCVGTVENGHIQIIDRFAKVPLPKSETIAVAKTDKNVAAFLSFSPVYRWEINVYDELVEVRFIDLRYRSKGHYPFVAVVQIDNDLNIINSYTGWIYSEQKLQSKLRFGDTTT